jgi:hypothetical protein
MVIKGLVSCFRGFSVFTLLVICGFSLTANAQLINWDQPANGSTFLDEGAAGGGGLHTGVDNDIFDVSGDVSVDIAWTEIGTLLGELIYGDDFVTWQDPTILVGGVTNGPFGGVSSEVIL